MSTGSRNAVGGQSIVEELMGQEHTSCRYCKQEGETSVRFGFAVDQLTCEDFQHLINKGFVRSGSHVYRPVMHKTCCPLYTIRLDAAAFAPTKSQKKVLTKLRKHLGSATDLEISTVPAAYSAEVFDLYKKYTTVVHGRDEAECTVEDFERVLVETPLIMEKQSVQDTSSCDQQQQQLTKSLAELSIGGDGSESGHTTDESSNGSSSGGPTFAYGTYHQLYRINGKLIAVGCIDILPECVSSVYCAYDPDCKDLMPGKLTVLKEIEFTAQLAATQPKIRSYTLGYYGVISNMAYKGDYGPAELLCPSTSEWVSLDACKSLLEEGKTVTKLSEGTTTAAAATAPPSPVPDEQQTEALTDMEHLISNIPILSPKNTLRKGFSTDAGTPSRRNHCWSSGEIAPLKDLCAEDRELFTRAHSGDILQEYVSQVGPQLAQRLPVKMRC